MMEHGRRASDSLTVVDTDNALSKEELNDLKQMARYWKAGRVVAGAILGLGALALASVQFYEVVTRWMTK